MSKQSVIVIIVCLTGFIQSSFSYVILDQAQKNFMRPKDGFLWVLGLNDISQSKKGEIFYLGAGEYTKKHGSATCTIKIFPHEIIGNSRLMEQKAILDCGEKAITVRCSNDVKLEPVFFQIKKENEPKAVVFNCDNGNNDIPGRVIFKGTEILSSTTLEGIEGKPGFKKRNVFPAKAGQKYSWAILGKTDKKILNIKIQMTYESPPKSWPTGVDKIVISEDGKSATLEIKYIPENGKIILGNDLKFAEGDPVGYLNIKVYIDDFFADEFWLNFKNDKGA